MSDRDDQRDEEALRLRMFTLYVQVQDAGGRTAEELAEEVRKKLADALRGDLAIKHHAFSNVYRYERSEPANKPSGRSPKR